MTDVPIVVRNLRFAISEDIPRYWMSQPKAFTLFVDHLSMVFPPGERFFIHSVRAFEKQVTDPKLREDIRHFNQQEALHSREHARFNDLLKIHGHPVDAIEGSARRILNTAKIVLSKRMQLSITCALEHYTAVFAQMLLSDSTLLKDAHPTMDAMWRWHAAEENEHSSVAFDVFKAVGGTHVERCLGMVLVTFFFWAKMLEHQVRMMHAANILWSPREWAGLWPVFFGTPGLAFTLARPYFAYFKPSFHPSELDCVDLLDSWKADFATQPEYLQSQGAQAA